MLLDLLSSLENAGLIRLAQIEPELEYLFRHALVQDATYASMLKEDRRRLHRAVGEVLESLYPDQAEDVAATLAHHFSLAEDEPRALRYLILAGDAAFHRYAVTEAITHYSRALETAGRIGEAAEVPWLRLCQNLGRALELDAQYERALKTYEEMGARARARGDRAMELVALTEHAKVHATPNPAHDAAEGQSLAERALALARELSDRPAEARIEWVMMLINWLSGSPDDALAHGERSLTLARESNLREQLAYTLQDLHRSYSNLGSIDRSRAALEEARVLWRELNNLPMLADNLASTADLLLNVGEYGPALEFANEAWQLSQSIGNLWNQAFGRAVVGEIHQVRGTFGPALQCLNEARELSERAGLVILYMRVCRDLAEAYLELNALEQARMALQPTLENARAGTPMHDMFWTNALLLRSQIELQAGRLDAAVADLDEVLGAPWAAARQRPVTVAVARAGLALARGEHEQALGIVNALLEWTGENLARQNWARICHLKAQALFGLGRLDAAVSLLHEGAQVARAMGLRTRLWQILVTLGRCKSLQRDAAAAAAAFGEARQIVEAVAADVGDPRLQEAFLGRPDVRALLEL